MPEVPQSIRCHPPSRGHDASEGAKQKSPETHCGTRVQSSVEPRADPRASKGRGLCPAPAAPPAGHPQPCRHPQGPEKPFPLRLPGCAEELFLMALLALTFCFPGIPNLLEPQRGHLLLPGVSSHGIRAGAGSTYIFSLFRLPRSMRSSQAGAGRGQICAVAAT